MSRGSGRTRRGGSSGARRTGRILLDDVVIVIVRAQRASHAGTLGKRVARQRPVARFRIQRRIHRGRSERGKRAAARPENPPERLAGASRGRPARASGRAALTARAAEVAPEARRGSPLRPRATEKTRPTAAGREKEPAGRTAGARDGQTESGRGAEQRGEEGEAEEEAERRGGAGRGARGRWKRGGGRGRGARGRRKRGGGRGRGVGTTRRARGGAGASSRVERTRCRSSEAAERPFGCGDESRPIPKSARGRLRAPRPGAPTCRPAAARAAARARRRLPRREGVERGGGVEERAVSAAAGHGVGGDGKGEWCAWTVDAQGGGAGREGISCAARHAPWARVRAHNGLGCST